MKEFFNKHKSNIIFLLILVGIVIRRCDFEWKQDLEDHFTIPSHSFSRQIYEKDGTLKDMKYITDLFLTYTKDTAWSDLPEFSFYTNISTKNSEAKIYRSAIINTAFLFGDYNNNSIFLTPMVYVSSDLKEYTNIYPALEIFEKAFPEDKEALGEISNSLPEYINTFIDNLSTTDQYRTIKYKYVVNIYQNDSNTYVISLVKKIEK